MSPSSTSSAPIKIPLTKSVRFRITLLVLLVSIIPVLLISAITYFQSRQLIREQIQQQMAAAAEISQQHVHEVVQKQNIRLSIFFERGRMRNTISRNISLPLDTNEHANLHTLIAEDFEASENESPVFDDLFIIDTEGQIRYATQTQWEGQHLEVSLANLPEGTYLYGSLPPVVAKSPALITIYRHKNTAGELQWIGIGIGNKKLAADLLIESARFHPHGSAYLITQNREFVGINPHTQEISVFTPSATQEASLKALQQAQDALIETGDASNLSVVAFAQPLEDLNTTLVLQAPEKILYQQLDSLLSSTLLISTLIILLLAFIVYQGTLYFTRPVLALIQAQQDFANGNFERRAHTIHRDDEIGILTRTFNKMADELTSLYSAMEARVRERTEQIRTAAEVAQTLAGNQKTEILLQKTVNLIVEHFDYYHAGIFLLDSTERFAELKTAQGPAAKAMLEQAHRLEVGSSSIVGWVSAHNQPRIVSEVSEDMVHTPHPLLPDTRSEAGIPIAIGNRLLGVLDVQSTNPNAFDEEAITTLTILANQLASSLYNAYLRETSDVDIATLDMIHRAGYHIVMSPDLETLRHESQKAMQDFTYPSIWLSTAKQYAKVIYDWDPLNNRRLHIEIPQVRINQNELQAIFVNGAINIATKDNQPKAPYWLQTLAQKIGTDYAVIIPIFDKGLVSDMVLIGDNYPAPPELLRAYNTLSLAISSARSRIQQQTLLARRLKQHEALLDLSSLLSNIQTLDELFQALHHNIQNLFGDYAFLVALYDEKTNSIRIPYLYENGQISSLESFPLGEGLTSIVLRTRSPLRLVENTDEQAARLGAKIVGQAAKSWLGVPLTVNNQAIGALIIQDAEHEQAFDEEDETFFLAIAERAAGLIQKIRLAEEARLRALQVQTASEIARDVSQFTNLDDLLKKAVQMIPERMPFYHAAVFLIDERHEYAVIQEGTGKVGLQMKQQGHKLLVGSKSTVGYASGRGEPLVINDTLKDATHKPHPLLPNTRAEAAIPLKIGERVIGVLDVQSTEPYAFDDESLRTLQILADQLAIAIENAELFSQTQENLSQQRLLHNVTAQAASGSSIEDALDTAVQGMHVTLGGDRVAIFLVETRTRTLRVAAARGYSEAEVKRMIIPLGRGITGWAAINKRSVRVDDTRKDARYIGMEDSKTLSELAIPLIYRNEVLGVLNVESEIPGAYSNETVEMLETMASNLAAIIANARLVERVRQQINREHMLYESANRIRRSTSMETVIQVTAQEIARALRVRRATIRIKPIHPDEAENEQ